MIAENRDFFYYDPEFKGEFGDFNDENVFSKEEKREFLATYTEFLKREYGLSDESQKVISEEELEKLTVALNSPVAQPRFSKRYDITDMECKMCLKPEEYSGWRFYTHRAKVKNDAIYFDGSELSPNPAALYSFNSNQKLKEAEFEFYMDREFISRIFESKLHVTTSCRTIELRRGIDEIVVIAVYPNGKCVAFGPNGDYYHPDQVLLGYIETDKWQSLKISLSDDTCDITLNGNSAKKVKLLSEQVPDTLYIGSGMHNIGDWIVKPIRFSFDAHEIKSFFKADTTGAAEFSNIGTVSLPFVAGNEENKDKTIVLEKDICLSEAEKIILTLNSLDPGGSVWLDDVLIAKTDHFDQLDIDITEHIKGKEQIHRLKIEVDPRAPEVLYRWHRQKDPYNGWFCEAVSITVFNAIVISDVKVATERIDDNGASVRISGKTDKPCRVRISFSEFGNAECKKIVGEYESNGEFLATECISAKPWSPESPNLYNIHIEAIDNEGNAVDDVLVETGFRTIEQRNGNFYLNNQKLLLKGALLMQFLPPYSRTSTTHICADTKQIVWQYAMLKKAGGNTMRSHILGYGSNDERYARLADRLGLLLIWTTRYIDSVELIEWNDEWIGKEKYISQLKLRINHPSIIMWEGSNEYRATLSDIDAMHRAFVNAVKAVDTTRLLTPVSHLYYAADSYPLDGCHYYSDDGTKDENGQNVKSATEWTDPLVVRSAHTYSWTLGYGSGWDNLRTQCWSGQEELVNSDERAYMVSEFSIIGRQDPNTKEAKEDFFNPWTYEFYNEISALGFLLDPEEWQLSQAHQAICAANAIKKLRVIGVDGMLWCCLMGGANDSGYLKPFIDNYGYAKLAYYTVREGFQGTCCLINSTDLKRGKELTISPILLSEESKTCKVLVTIEDMNGVIIASKDYGTVYTEESKICLDEWKPELCIDKGYYSIKTTVSYQEDC